MSEAVHIANAIAACKAAFPNFNPDPEKTPEVWLLGLSDLAPDTLQAAVLALITENGRAFAPSIGEIRGAAMTLHAKAAGIPDAFQAYEEVVNMPATMIRRNITTERTELGSIIIDEIALKFSHPIVEATARTLGWPERFPNPDASMAGVDRAQFVKAYDAELARLMGDAGRLPMLNEYIESRRDLRGGSPLLTGAVRQLEGKGER